VQQVEKLVLKDLAIINPVALGAAPPFLGPPKYLVLTVSPVVVITSTPGIIPLVPTCSSKIELF